MSQKTKFEITRLQPKQALVDNEHSCAGNICSLVVGVTATKGDITAYVDGVTGCLDLTEEQYKAQVSSIVNDFISGQHFKETLESVIESKSKKPVSVNIVVDKINI